jgi:hypothetical protein
LEVNAVPASVMNLFGLPNIFEIISNCLIVQEFLVDRIGAMKTNLVKASTQTSKYLFLYLVSTNGPK